MTTRRIARVITRLNIGGPSIQAITLSRELRSFAFDTELIYGRLGEGEGDMTSILPVGDTRLRYVNTLVRPISPLQDLSTLWQLYRCFCRERPAIVHTHMAKAGALGRLAAIAYNWTAGSAAPARLVHTYHGHVFEGYFGSPSTKVFLLIERWLGRRTDALIAISPQIRRDLLQTYQIATDSRVRLIPLGFDLDRFSTIGAADRVRARGELDLPPHAVVVTTVGRLTPIKQHDLLLDAIGLLAAGNPDLLLLIVGDGELRQALESQVASRGLKRAVRFLGWRGDLERVYAATDVFVLTSRNEGTPVALIEAMASGLPAVSTDVGGVRDVVVSPDAGSLVPFGDASALAAALQRYADSPALRETTGRAARESVGQRFTLQRLVRDIRALYDELLERSH